MTKATTLTLCLMVTMIGSMLPTPAAAVLCMKKSGALFVRDACKRKETAVSGDLLGTGPQGPPGSPGRRALRANREPSATARRS
jgi:hypothetical protein